MNDDTGGVGASLLNALTGGLVQALLRKLSQRIQLSQPGMEIRDHFDHDKISNSAKELFDFAVANAKRGVELPMGVIRGLLNDKRNREILLSRTIEHTSHLKVDDVSALEIERYLTNYDEQFEQAKVFLKTLLGNIESEKTRKLPASFWNLVSHVSAEHAKTRDLFCEQFSNLEKKFDSISKVSTPDDQSVDQLLEKGKIISATKLAKSQLVKTKNDAHKIELLLKLARVAGSQRDKAEQASLIDQAAQLSPVGSPQRLRREALAAYYRDDISEAVRLIERIPEDKLSQRENAICAATILLAAGRKNESLALIDSFPDTDFDIVATKVMALAAMDRYEDALKLAKSHGAISPESLHAQDLVLRTLFQFGVFLAEQEGPGSDTARALFNETVAQSGVVFDLVDEQQIQEKVEVLAMRAQAAVSADRLAIAYEAIQEALQVGPVNDDVLMLAAQIAWIKGETSEALKYLRTVPQHSPSSERAEILVADILVERGEVNSAEEFIKQALTRRLEPDTEAQLLSQLVEIEDRLFKTTEAANVIERLKRAMPNSHHVALSEARHLARIGRLEEATATLEPFASDPDLPHESKAVVRITLAELLLRTDHSEDAARAAELIRPFVSPQEPELRTKFLIALYKSDRFDECLAACGQAKSGGLEIGYSMAATINMRLENFDAAARDLEYLVQKFPGNLQYVGNYAFALFRMGAAEEAADVVRQAEHRTSDPESLALLSTIYQRVGESAAAVKCAYQAVVGNPASADLLRNYMMICLQGGDALSQLGDPYVARYRQALNEYNDLFPEDDAIRRFEVPEDPEQMVAVLTRILASFQPDMKAINEVYKHHRMPVSFLATALNRDIVTTWLSLIQSGCPLWCDSGNQDLFSREIATAQQSEVIIVDPAGLLACHDLGVIGKLTQKFKTVLVCQSTVDLFQQIHMRHIVPEQGYVFLVDNQLSFQKASPEFIELRKTTIDAILRVIGAGGSVQRIGISPGRRDRANEYQKYENAFGKTFIEPYIEGAQRSIPVLGFDLFTRKAGAEVIGVETTGVQAFVHALYKDRDISEMDFLHLTEKMITNGFRFVTVNALLLKAAVRQHPLADELPVLFQGLKDPDIQMDSLVAVCSEFLAWVWVENLTPSLKCNWTVLLLASVQNLGAPFLDQSIARGTVLRLPKLAAVSERGFTHCYSQWVRATKNGDR